MGMNDASMLPRLAANLLDHRLQSGFLTPSETKPRIEYILQCQQDIMSDVMVFLTKESSF